MSFILPKEQDPSKLPKDGVKSLGACEYITVTSSNPLGSVPLWLVNACSTSVPRQWFADLQKGTTEWEKKKHPELFTEEKSTGWFY